jgi:SnoaL-like domain
MRRFARLPFILMAMLLTAGLTATPAFAKPTDIAAQTRLLLDAYARGDRSTVLGLIDENSITVYGSDFAEVCHGSAAFETLLSNDLRLWGGPAHIGAMEHVSIIETDGMASIFFDAPFSAGGRPPLPVRFAMVWRRTGDEWRLVQSSNVAPTQGQSAAQLLGAGVAKDPAKTAP